MASNDAEVFNTLERALSGDLNDLQSIATRVEADLMRYGQSLRTLGIPADSPRNVVFGGLTGSPSGADVAIAPGVLGQDSAVLPPVPGPLDSTYRLARNDVPTVVVMPAPGATTFYLIEAQMVQVITSTQLRDVYNPGLMIFAPALLTKQVEHQIIFQVLVGGANAPAPTGGDWVPICIVRRPAGGGPVLASDIVDVRPLAEWGRERPTKPVRLEARIQTEAPPANNARIFAEIDGPGGARSFELLGGTTDITTARFLSPTTVLAAAARFYLYLAPWSALSLNPRFDGGVSDAFEGVLVLSDVPPTNSFRNSAPVALPAPFGVVPAPTSSAYYLGTLLRNSTNVAWVPSVQASGKTMVAYQDMSALLGPFVQLFTPPVAANNSVLLNKISPIAQSVILDIVHADAAAHDYTWSPGGVAYVVAEGPFSGSLFNAGKADVQCKGSATLDVDITGAIGGGSQLVVSVVGWRE